MPRLSTRLAALALSGASGTVLLVSGPAAAGGHVVPPAAIEAAAEKLDIRVYDDHLVTLASPFMEGRLPGTRGYELATEYVEFWFKEHGLEAPFGDNGFLQPFDLGGQMIIDNEMLAYGDITFEEGVDFEVSGMGGSIDVDGAPLVFVGYSIESGPEDYTSYPGDESLAGKIAVMLRFEPMDEDGRSLWAAEGRPWTGAAGFNQKLRSARERGAAGAIIINTPGADDPRAEGLPGGRGGRGEGMPVIMMSADAGAKLAKAAGSKGLMDLRRHADEGGGPIDLAPGLVARADVGRETVVTHNVGALLRGKGVLKDELIVIGAHLDHLGNGDFGSREGPGKLHPGADDNASGSAAIIMLADKISDVYADMDDDANARSILFLCFSAEESGLNGSRAYVQDPIMPIEQHALMINFDMIGRIEDGRLSVSGMNTGEGMREWIQPYFERSKLNVVQPERLNGASDHTSFQRQGVPVLFGILDQIHDDYHTSRDVTWKINRVDAVRTVKLFEDIAIGLAQRTDRFAFVESAGRRGGRGGGGGGGGGGAGAGAGAGTPAAERAAAPAAPTTEIKVRVGIVPGEEEDLPGVVVTAVTPDTSASEAGLQVGDRIVMWNKDKVENLIGWIQMLAAHEPGDEVQAEVIRDGEEIRVMIKLRAK